MYTMCRGCIRHGCVGTKPRTQRVGIDTITYMPYTHGVHIYDRTRSNPEDNVSDINWKPSQYDN